jgi:hypothetical protein
LDSLLARNCSCDPDRDHLAREVSQGAALVFDCPIRVAFLGGLHGDHLGTDIAWHLVPRNPDDREALI